MRQAGQEQIEWPDPRTYGSGRGHPLVAIAAAEQFERSRLTALLRELAAAGDDAAIAAAFAEAPNQMARRRLLEALKNAIDDPAPEESDGLRARLFAMPIVIVAGGLPGAVIPGHIADPGAIGALLRAHGALGQTENFGLAAALVSEAALDAVPPSLLLQWTRSVGDPQADTRAFPGSDLHVAAVDEHAHLRFLVGAGVAPAQAVSFVESASRIGAWGMPVTRALAQQLAQDGLSLLPLPRPPKSLVTAAASGHFALEETRLNLFMSRVLRQLRASAGEPVAVLSVHAGGEVRLGLSSIFDSAVLHGFRWRLGLFDDLDEVVDVLLTLLRDCRIPDVRIVPGLQPACDAQGTAHFLSIHDLGPSDEVRR